MRTVVGIALLASACSRAPVREIAEAQAAIDAAARAGAEDYAYQEFRSAKDTLTAANTQVAGEDFRGARVTALDAKTRAEEASARIEAGKTSARAAAKSQLEAAEAHRRVIETLLPNLPPNEKAFLTRDLRDLVSQFDPVRADMQGGRYRNAQQDSLSLLQAMKDVRDRAEKASGK